MSVPAWSNKKHLVGWTFLIKLNLQRFSKLRRNMKTRMLIIAISVLLTGCATYPSKMEANYVNSQLYGNWDCDRIERKTERTKERGNILYEKLDERARTDNWQGAVGVLLIWPALFLLDGDGAEAKEFKEIKGEYKALSSAAQEKSCSIGNRPHWI